MKNLYPTAAELYALERDARRMRAQYIARLFRAATKGWQALLARRAVKGLRHA